MEEKKPIDRNALYAILTVLLFAALSLAAIFWMKGQEAQVLPNDTAALVRECFVPDGWVPSQKQEDIIAGSVEILSNEAEDAGVKVTLRAAYGNGYVTNYLVDVVLPEGMNAGEGCFFENEFLTGEAGTNSVSIQYLEDKDGADNRYSLLLGVTRERNLDSDRRAVHTLHLENIVLGRGDDPNVELLQGSWDFDLHFCNLAQPVEMIREPITVPGYSFGDGAPFYYQMEISSFVLSELSANCDFQVREMSDGVENGRVHFEPWVIMKNGSTIDFTRSVVGNSNGQFVTHVPIPLDEVAYVVLGDNVLLKMP